LAGEGHLGTVADFQLVEPGVGREARGQFVEQRRQRRLRHFAADQVLRGAAGIKQLLAQRLNVGHLRFLLAHALLHGLQNPLTVIEPQHHGADHQGAAQPRQAALQALAGWTLTAAQRRRQQVDAQGVAHSVLHIHGMGLQPQGGAVAEDLVQTLT